MNTLFLTLVFQAIEPEQGPTNLRFGGGVSHDTFHPLVLLLVLFAGTLILVLPRKKAIFPFLATALLIPTDQVLLLGHLHFPMLRVLVLFGLVRMLWSILGAKDQLFSGGINRIDVTLLACAVVTAVNAGLLWQSSAALVNQAGVLYTIFGSYCLIRFLVRDGDDVTRLIRGYVYIATFIAAIMIVEHVTKTNPVYSLFGGARASLFASVMERDGKYRATASFVHPILAGTFGAVLLPLFVGLWWKDKASHALAVLGLISATVITLASNSSTPVLSYAAALLALGLWPLRRRMRLIRWGVLITIVSLHLVMKAPVWHLISRVDVLSASSGYHRYQLVNQCILHFWQWCAVGVKDTSTWGWDMWDTANQYVAIADYSGLIPLILFIGVLAFAFQFVGRGRAAADSKGDRTTELFLWALGATLFANAVGFFGISYEEQTFVTWYALLAVIIASSQSVSVAVPETQAEPEPVRLPWRKLAIAPGGTSRQSSAYGAIKRNSLRGRS
ncbi:MAG TPA: hypothetical protein VMH20_15250 [Verrucomicrobiae bacterium]|nr:hypothetical protein [Verrucomicrobiae bacterium]